MSMYNQIKKMHKKFNLLNEGCPVALTDEEYRHRCAYMYEELVEYMDATFEGVERKEAIFAFNQALNVLPLKDKMSLTDQKDALIDLTVFTMGTAQRQAFKFEAGFDRVIAANLKKELAENSSNSKRGFARDLVKPEGWTAPNFEGLMDSRPTGIIVLDGPDACGKTTLADYFVKWHGAEHLHLTWSPELERKMDGYMLDSLTIAQETSKEKLVIIDRLWLSELVYSEVYRNGSNWKGLHRALYGMLDDLNAINIICLPRSEEKYIQHFNETKSKREEMYNDMTSVYRLYSSLWDGVNMFQDSGLTEDICACGGLKVNDAFFRYDFMERGHDLANVCAELLKELSNAGTRC